MRSRPFAWFGVCAILAAVSLGVFLFWYTISQSPRTPVPVTIAGVPSAPPAPNPIEVAVENLTKNGWPRDSAVAVAECQQRSLRLNHEEDPAQFDKKLKILLRLSEQKYRLVLDRLAKHPELAGLLAGSLAVDLDGPTKIMDTIPDGPDELRDAITSLYGLNADPQDAVKLSMILKHYDDLVIPLYRRAAIDLMAFLNVYADSEDAVEYRKWVRELLRSALDEESDAALERAQTLLKIHAKTIRDLLSREESFRHRFFDEYWPAYDRVLRKYVSDDDQIDLSGDDDGEVANFPTEWTTYAQVPEIWEFFQEWGTTRAAEMFERKGPVAVSVLMESHFKTCRDQLWALLEYGNPDSLEPLHNNNLVQRPEFLGLLERNIPSGTLAKALVALKDAGVNAPARLAYFQGLGDDALKEELGPPPSGVHTWLPGYSTYYAIKKTAQGREVTTGEMAFAAFDVASIAIPVAKGAAVVRVVQKGVAKSLAKQGLTAAAREIAEVSVSQAAKRQFGTFALRFAQRAARQALEHAKGNIDVTKLVRFAFAESGLGRETFRRITNLEARVFMRGDRRVVVQLGESFKSTRLGSLLIDSAFNAGVDMAMATPLGQAAVEYTMDQTRAWKEHIAVWFMANVDGSLDKLIHSTGVLAP